MDFLATDHLRHRSDSTGRMRDSLFWQATLPGQRLGFQAYLYLTHAGKAGFNVVVWGEDARPLVFDFAEGTIPDDMDLDDFSFAGLRLRKTGFGEPARVEYASAKANLSFTFTGLHSPFSYHANPDGLPAWFAANRYEQTGTISGSIEAKGRAIPLEGMAHRDHSWGNRDWGVPHHWKWFVAYTPDGARMVNGWIWIARGEWGCAGYVVRDGRQVAIAGIRQSGTFQPDMSQQSLRAEIVDVEGGTCLVELERFGLVKLPTKDRFGTLIQEAACTGRVDGMDAAGQYETHWQKAYLDYLVEAGVTG